MIQDSQQLGRGLHVISLVEQKVLKLGRGHDSDVYIDDLSVSRCHATIRFQDGQFLLEDQNSKFGTVVAMKKPRALEASQLSIQVWRTVLTLHRRFGAQRELCSDGASLQPPQASSTTLDEQALRLSLLTHGGGSSLHEMDHEAGDSEALRLAPEELEHNEVDSEAVRLAPEELDRAMQSSRCSHVESEPLSD